MGQIPGALGKVKDVNEADLGDLSTGEKVGRGFMGAAGGGLQGLQKMQQQQPQGGQAPPIGIQQPQFVDFSQLGRPKSNGFYGG